MPKKNQVTVQIHILGQDYKPVAATAAGEVVDIGLPAPYRAICHRTPDKNGWQITEEKSGRAMFVEANKTRARTTAAAANWIADVEADWLLNKLQEREQDFLDFRARLWAEAEAQCKS